jgi:hypothetical protein
LTRRDPVLVDDFARPNPSHEALRNNLPLLLNRNRRVGITDASD